MSDDINIEQKKPRNNKVLMGVVLLLVGGALLIHQLNLLLFPSWLISWPMLLVAFGVYNCAKHNFRNSGWLIITRVGMVWLLNEAIPGHDVGRVTWPVGIIIFGLWMIMRKGNRWEKTGLEDKWDWRKQPIPPVTPDPNAPVNPDQPYTGYVPHNYGDDYLDAVSVFGGVKKTILSKDFKGGDIVNIFGGAELDLTQADINGRVVLDITQIFGGTKIVVPSNWQVVSDIAAVFASVDDKRLRSTAGAGGEKILVLKGVSIFAGIDIRSY